MAKRRKSRRGKRKPTAFNRCVGRALRAAAMKSKPVKYRTLKQWQNEFRKAAKKCAGTKNS